MIGTDGQVPEDYANATFYDLAIRAFELGKVEAGLCAEHNQPSVLPETGPVALRKFQNWVATPFIKLQTTILQGKADEVAAAYCEMLTWCHVAAFHMGYNLDDLGKAFIKEYLTQIDDPAKRDPHDDHQMTLHAMRKAFGFPLVPNGATPRPKDHDGQA